VPELQTGISTISQSVKTVPYVANSGSQCPFWHLITETRLSVYSRCKRCQRDQFLSCAWKYWTV